MSVARCCGFEPDGSLVEQIRQSWLRWCREEPDLEVVAELDALPGWTRRASKEGRSVLFRRLARRTGTDADAVAALVWLMLPAGVRIARELRDKHPDIDALVAGQLWIECRHAHLLKPVGIATSIKGRVKRAVCADLGIGDGGRRRDRVWVDRVQTGESLESVVLVRSEETPTDEVDELLERALLDRVIAPIDACLIRDLAIASYELQAAPRRGRSGLTAPAVLAEVSTGYESTERTLRRHAVAACIRLREYALVRNDSEELAVWKLQHPLIPLTAREEVALAAREEEWWDLITGPEKLSPEDAWDRVGPAPWRRWRA